MKRSAICRAVLAIAGLLLLPACDKLAGFAAKRTKPIPLSSLDAPDDVKNLLQSHASRAARLDRNALLHFSLVNCGPCIKLDEEVLAQREWRDFAKAHLVETVVEFPNEFTSEDTELARNMQALEGIGKRLGLPQGFPVLVVLGRDGSILGGRGGFKPDGVAGYVRWAEGLLANDTSPRTPTAAAVAEKAGKPDTNSGAQEPPAALTRSETVTNAPPSGQPLATPVSRTSTAVQSAPAANAPPKTAMDHFTLRGIAGRTVLLHTGSSSYSLREGQKREVKTPAGDAVVLCKEIREAAVVFVVWIGTEERQIEIPLRGPTGQPAP